MIEAIQDNSNLHKRAAAVVSLGQVSEQPGPAGATIMVVRAVGTARSLKQGSDRVLPAARLLALALAMAQIVESTGSVMTPYMDFPQLLALLLRMLHEGSIHDRLPIMKVRALERGASAPRAATLTTHAS